MTEEYKNCYELVCEAAAVEPFRERPQLLSFIQPSQLANKGLNERLVAGLQVLMECVSDDKFEIDKVDRLLLDRYIATIDHVIGLQLDEILHHDEFQALESLWKSTDYITQQTELNQNLQLELLDVSKDQLQTDFDEASDLTQTGLFQQIYIDEYDSPGGEPFAAMITPYEFTASHQDIKLLRDCAQVSARTHCPFLASVGPTFFDKDTFDDVINIEELGTFLDRAEYIRWQQFRETEAARYVGLTLPKFLLRLPYGEQNPVRKLSYREHVEADNAKDYLWGSATYPLAVNLLKSFRDHGWCVNIRGPEGGGKVSQLLLHQHDLECGTLTKIPTQCRISETHELAFAEHGFIPLSYYKGSDNACFFSVNSVQKPALYDSDLATANSRINARLPYIFLSSRIAHYLKVLQREKIGSNTTQAELEKQLNEWLQTLVTHMNNPSAELTAKHPLRSGSVKVLESRDDPGYYQVQLTAVPHFQIEGMDVSLNLTSQLPTRQHKHN